MADLDSFADQASLYVLGELNAADRREFEMRLGESAELRALVRELEEGVVAASMACPGRRLPKQLWRQIEQAVAAQSRRPERNPRVSWANWWRTGWAAAAVCLLGWLLYAFWVRPLSTHRSLATAPSESKASLANPPADTHSEPSRALTNYAPAEDPGLSQLLQAQAQEAAQLRWRIIQLSNDMSELALVITQQQVLLSEPSRFKIFQLTPPHPGGSSSGGLAPISTNLQRALFLAMARELGWLPPQFPPAATEIATNIASRSAAPSHPNGPTTNLQAGVDFVDLRPGSAVPTDSADTAAAPVELEPVDSSQSPLVAAAVSSPTNAIPGFVSGTNAVLAFDSSVAPIGRPLTFHARSASGEYLPIGSVYLGTNPMIVTIPLGVPFSDGGSVTVISGKPPLGSSGGMSVLGVFPREPAK